MSLPAVFPDWSPYPDLESAARAYLRDPEVALEAVSGVLGGAEVLGFTLERFVNEHNGVWQELALCDGARLLLWHGEDVEDGTAEDPHGPAGGSAMISSLRVVPLSVLAEVGFRRRLRRSASGPSLVTSIDVYLLLSSIDEANGGGVGDSAPLRQDALRFGKTLEDGGAGQIARLEQFAQLVAGLAGCAR